MTGSPVGRALFGLACCVVLVLTFVLGVLVGRQWARSTPPALDDEYARRGLDDARTDWLAVDRSERRSGPGAGAGVADEIGRRPSRGADDQIRGAPVRGLASDDRTSRGPRLGVAAADRETGRQPGRGVSPGARASEDTDRAAAQIQQKLTFYHTLTAPLAAGPPPAPKPPLGAVGTAPSRGAAPVGARRLPLAPETYTVQVAALTTREQADALRGTLGEGAYVIELDRASPARYRVRVGAFASRADAEAVAARLRAASSLTAFVTTTTR